MESRFLRVFLPIAIVLVAILIFIIMLLTAPGARSAGVGDVSTRVKTLRVKVQSLEPTVILYGRTETPKSAIIKAAIIAEVIGTPVLEGEKVAKGQLLVQLADHDILPVYHQYQAEVTRLKAQIKGEVTTHSFELKSLIAERKQFAFVKNQLKRFQYLAKRKLVSKSDSERAEANLALHQVKLNQLEAKVANHNSRLAQLKATLARYRALLAKAKLDIRRTKIVAPFAGKISKLYVSVGNRVKPEEKIIGLYDTNGVEVRALIPSRYIGTIKKMINKGRRLSAVAVFNGKTISLSLFRLASVISVGQSSVATIFRVMTKKTDLPLGLALEIKLTLPKIANIMAVPASALYRKNSVYKVVNNRLVAVNVTIVGSKVIAVNKELYLVKSNELKTGDRVITTVLAHPLSGQKVTVVD